jgi:hypothetical protein
MKFDSNVIIKSLTSEMMLDIGFHRESTENCALPGYYAMSNGNFLLPFRDSLSVPFSRFWIFNPEDRSDRLSRNDGKKIPLLAV